MQTSLIICLIVFVIILIILEKISAIKILIRLALSIGIIWIYLKSIVDGKSIGIASLIVSISLVVINVVIEKRYA